MASLVTYIQPEFELWGVNLDQGKRNLVPVSERFELSKVKLAE